MNVYTQRIEGRELTDVPLATKIDRVTVSLKDGARFELCEDDDGTGLRITCHDGPLAVHPEVSNSLAVKVDRFR